MEFLFRVRCHLTIDRLLVPRILRFFLSVFVRTVLFDYSLTIFLPTEVKKRQKRSKWTKVLFIYSDY